MKVIIIGTGKGLGIHRGYIVYYDMSKEEAMKAYGKSSNDVREVILSNPFRVENLEIFMPPTKI